MTYGSKEDFVEYHESRGREIPALWDDVYIESSLLVASEWIDGAYGPYFTGYKTGGYEQEREWPRSAATVKTIPIYNIPPDVIPKEVERATYEAAWRQANNPGSLQVDYTPAKYRSVSIDGAVSVEYAQFTTGSDVQVEIGIVETLLSPLLTESGNFSGLSGHVERV